jgi:hypothetical protein
MAEVVNSNLSDDELIRILELGLSEVILTEEDLRRLTEMGLISSKPSE